MQKTSFKTRLLALLTAVFMVIMCVPFAAFADAQDYQVVNLIYWDEESNQKVCDYEGTEGLVVDASKTYLTNEDVQSKMPNGYTFYSDIATATYQINGGWCRIGVKQVPAPTTKTIEINYYCPAEKKSVGSEKLTVAAKDTSINTSKLTVPTGYALVATGDLDITTDGYVYAEVKAAPTTKEIEINYYCPAEKKSVGSEKLTVAADATEINTSKFTAVPAGHELVESGDLPIRDGYVYAEVKEVPTTKTIKINYYSEAEEKQIAEVDMTVAADATYINTSALTAPEGYELVLSGDLAIRDGYVYAAVKKIGSKTVKINYYSEAEEKQIAEVEMTVAPDATCVNTSKLTAPTGYELVEVGDLPIRDGYVYAAVRKVSTKEVKINFYCPEEKKQVAEPTVVVNADATYVNSSAYAALVPAGYELAEVGDMPIRDGYVYAEVRKVATKTVKINYYSEAEEKQIAEVEMTVAPDATCVNTSKLTAPTGYELVEVGDLPIRDGYVYAAVRKVSTKEVKINFYCPEEKKQVAEPTVVVNADATYVNSSAYAALVPAGYELAEVGDMPIRDGYVYAEVRKVATKTIKINYYSEEEEKQIAEVEMTVPADATYVNTSALTAPAGYKLVLAGDLPIRDGYVYAAVRKVPTTTIKISYVDEATDKEVGTEDLVVNQGTTVVNFNVLKSVPAGYELCEVGDFYVGNGSAKVMVRKTKSNNGSSSSSSSSSSNTTNTSASNTTNTSASQKQVVKAAAAPANNTKVLPKTGATNAAPLIGGSLAVVALLMGYGVYGLVLRKKD